MALTFGPDAARYWIAGQGRSVARPFNLRWLLPALCRNSERRWWAVWLISWPLAAAGCIAWAHASGASWGVSVAAAALLLALPGVLGPQVARPVGVDLPALALGLLAAAAFASGQRVLGIALVLVAANVRETVPVAVALWCWSPLPLVGLIVPALVAMWRRPELDEITAQPLLRRIHEHPIRSALEHHRGHWRDAWHMVAPWGATVAALLAVTPQLVVTLIVAHLQLLVATDEVRLTQTLAGPVVALAAAQVFPLHWLPLVVILHFVWWRKPLMV
jgi:hypothetical protein